MKLLYELLIDKEPYSQDYNWKLKKIDKEF